MNRFCSFVLGSALLFAGNSASADTPFEDEIEARQGLMTVVGFNMGILGGMAKGKVPYDAAKAEAAAKNIYAASTMDTSAMWPPGSDNSNPKLKGETDALPYIWKNFPEIGEKHTDWVKASEALAANAGKSLGDLRKNIGAVGKSCKGCHKVAKAD